MAIEIEAKMRLENPTTMRERLAALGAQSHRQLRETNIFFDTGDGQLKSTDQGLRVRIEAEDAGPTTTYITHKGPRAHGKLKSRAETEAVVADAEAAGALLAALGYQAVVTFEKRRSCYEIDGCQVELDTLPYLGDFIEIEGPTEDEVMATRDKLGLADQPLIKASYIAMLQDHLNQQGIRENSIRFPETVEAIKEAG